MNIVLLDSGTLPTPLTAPGWASDWSARPTTRAADVVHALEDAAIAITNKVPIRAADLDRLPKLRFVCVAATGFDCIDIDACRESGVIVSNVPGYSDQSVAEWALASIFALRRNLFAYRDAARIAWPASPYFCVHDAPILDIAGSTLGIVGRGAIGNSLARLARAVGMNVIFAEHRGRPAVREGFTPFDDVTRSADVLSLHCPLTEATRNLIDAPTLRAMKRGALLVNSARGGLVDSAALVEALATGHLGGAALDVLPQEPPDPHEPLLTCAHPNLIVTPHISWAATNAANRLNAGIEANLAAFHAGAPINVVNGA
ncbi:D-2-hydroxyacid dehydrogenase [Paraburkholderia haematera]|uniref:2-hydroxyacid dehydrogenase n=1 Tax=Paraburkholderia haematera TaxID=2793077 RepID=A0ABM8RBQ5_9BURK|nr:D-2-hydroxyacid dehydrogenase [Paraburkholderia haematera]CAE6743696.1 Putative 2-hydroxyacid dehydrogenase [Paraburkholderia haematera]